MENLIHQPEWRGLDMPTRAALRRRPAPGVEIHHSDTGRAPSRDKLIRIAQSIYRDHIKRPTKSGGHWADVFYGWLVGDGWVLECRGYDRLSGEVPHMTVCLVGRYVTGGDQPTPFQLSAIVQLRQLVIARGGGPELVWHSMRAETTCPGGHLITHLETMRRRPFPTSQERPTTPPTPLPTPAPVPSSGEDYAMDRLDLRNAHQVPVRGRHVDNLQGLLMAAGYGPSGLVGPSGLPDGIAGATTRADLGAFQRVTGTGSNGGPDYVVGPRTWRALIER